MWGVLVPGLGASALGCDPETFIGWGCSGSESCEVEYRMASLEFSPVGRTQLELYRVILVAGWAVVILDREDADGALLFRTFSSGILSLSLFIPLFEFQVFHFDYGFPVGFCWSMSRVSYTSARQSLSG